MDSDMRRFDPDQCVGASSVLASSRDESCATEDFMALPFYKYATVVGLTLLSSAAHAATVPEDALTNVTVAIFIASALFVLAVIVFVYFMKTQDKRSAPVENLFDERESIHSAGPDAWVTECVRKMAAEKVGALVIMEGERLVGIFTERDALNKVLAAGLEPGTTKVSQVMTKNPFCISPTMTVGDAMELVTRRRFRHLPIVKDGKVLGVISSGDLTHWLVKDRVGDVQELVDLAAPSSSRAHAPLP
jgi:CBS domain-containing protein